jgi:hypothetical protein
MWVSLHTLYSISIPLLFTSRFPCRKAFYLLMLAPEAAGFVQLMFISKV